MEDQERILDDPLYMDSAVAISTAAGEDGTPLSWRIQENGTLTVILPSGKKVRAHLPLRAVQGSIPEGGNRPLPALKAPPTGRPSTCTAPAACAGASVAPAGRVLASCKGSRPERGAGRAAAPTPTAGGKPARRPKRRGDPR